MSIGRFYAGIGAVIWSPELEQYLLLRRSDDKDFAPGAWECVTGRVDQGEGFEEALHREFREELDVDAQVEYMLGTTHFYRGEPIPENELVGVIYLCSLANHRAVRISEEHSEYRWLPANQAIELLTSADTSSQWARQVIQRTKSIHPLLPDQLLESNKKIGFELG